jgi:hypothetical protein
MVMVTLVKKQLKERYKAKLKEDGTTIGEMYSCAGGYNVFSLIPGESFDLLVAAASTIEDTLAAFVRWKEREAKKKEGP